jgi:hypothetical protein
MRCGLQKHSNTVATKGQERPELTVPQSLVVASLAGIGNVLVTNPIWLPVTRMQAASKHDRHTTFVEELRGIVREGGVPALWTVKLPAYSCACHTPKTPLQQMLCAHSAGYFCIDLSRCKVHPCRRSVAKGTARPAQSGCLIHPAKQAMRI